MITVQTWKPDTCGCELEQYVDKQHGSIDFSRIVRSCKFHTLPRNGHSHHVGDPCTGRYIVIPIDMLSFKIGNGYRCPAGQKVYDVINDENKLKNRTVAYAMQVVPWEHVFREVLADDSIAERIGPRMIAEADIVAALTLLQLVEYAPKWPRLAPKLGEKVVLTSYSWKFDDARKLLVDFEIPLRPEHRVEIEKMVTKDHGLKRIEFMAGMKENVMPTMLELMARQRATS